VSRAALALIPYLYYDLYRQKCGGVWEKDSSRCPRLQVGSADEMGQRNPDRTFLIWAADRGVKLSDDYSINADD
jgi:hypothetical protein